VKKLKHSKFKNTGLLFELLVRQITADVLENKDSFANELLRKYFTNDTMLGKEQRLYQLMAEETVQDSGRADRFIDVVISERRKLDNRELDRQKYELISELKNVYPIDSFLSGKLKNYKTYASVYKLFESSARSNVECDPRDICDARTTLVECLSGTNKPVDDNEEIAHYMAQDETTRLIGYKLLVEGFNKKYKNLSDKQRELLKQYVNNVSNTNLLREYVDAEIPQVRTQIETLMDSVDDDVVKIKLNEVCSQLSSIVGGKRIHDSEVSTLLMCYELINELEVDVQ